VSVVTRRSASYFRALSTAGYLVNNSTFPAEFGKRPGQVYVNTWHGTPLKRMGYDIPSGGRGVGNGTGNVVRNFLQADFLVSASPFMTDQMYARAYRLGNLFRGLVIEEGYPRIDRQAVDQERAREIVAGGRPWGPGRVVLYAPTWRGEAFNDPRDDSATLVEQVRRLSQRLGDGWTVRVKVHQAVYAAARRLPGLDDVLIDNDIPTNVVLAAVDVLVADYSSIIVDFLALDRPIVVFAPDRADYGEVRGLYEPAPGWPGPVLADIDEVADVVAQAGTGGPGDPALTHLGARRQWRDRLCPREDGRASQRVVDVVFAGARDGRNLVDLSSDGRARILIYVGELKPNGMTTSALNLLRAIDHTRFDVTALFPDSHDPDCVRAAAAIDPRVRRIPRTGGMAGSAAAQLARQVVQRRGVAAHREDAPLARSFRTEWQRCFGQAEFDCVVDFVGYSPFWSLLLLQAGAPRRAIWLHNDMVADSRRAVDGRQPLRRNLEAVFSTYRFFDRLVSVSPALRDVNRAGLAQYAAAEQFTYAVNAVDADSVRARAASQEAWQLPSVPEGTITFLASGRLSSAKNYPRLVAAFAQVRQEYPRTRLVILGEGAERPALEAQIDELGVADGVLLAGHQPNPFSAMSASDCFVLSSDHEGQPMVILEALVLGLPVITTRFASVDSALPPGEGLVVERSVEGVADGMRAFLRGEVPTPHFDSVSYNRQAVAQFVRAVGLESVGDGDLVP
jgi:CDP-glycerol glycerophosphotransferase (TagB/SpsB family)/glycosyltransferase involved in cell wall biosynthesis